jgi:hypothetical protein
MRQVGCVAPPPRANPVNSLSVVANTEVFRAPGVQRIVKSNARCVLRSDRRCLNVVAWIQFFWDLNPELFRPRHAPYKMGNAEHGRLPKLGVYRGCRRCCFAKLIFILMQDCTSWIEAERFEYDAIE